MTLQQLEYALVLNKHGSFKRASEKLKISQPGLSLQIQKLEDNLGILLFDRSKTPVEPTEDGRLFLVRAEDIVLSAKQLKEFVSEVSYDFKGSLKIGIIPTLAPFLVPLFIDELQRDYPEFDLDIQEMTTENAIMAVRNGELDLGIISTPVNVFGIKSRPIFYEKFYFYTANDIESDKISLNNIDYDNLWLLNEGNCFRDQINDFCNINEFRKNKQLVYRSNSIDALIRIVDNKGGITILPELTTLSLSSEQEDKIITIENKAREIGVITRNSNLKERFIEKMIEYIQSNIPHHMLSNSGLEIVDPNIQMR